MGLYEVPLSMSLLGFGMGTMLDNFHYVWYYVFVNSSFKHASPRGPMCFWCLMFSLSGPCESLLFLCCISSWNQVVESVMLYYYIFCVALLMDVFVLCVGCLTVFVKQFVIFLGVVVILLLNVLEVLSVGGGALFDIPCMAFQILCLLCL